MLDLSQAANQGMYEAVLHTGRSVAIFIVGLRVVVE
jgi:hypothetical protein